MSMKNFRNMSLFRLGALNSIKLDFIFLDYKGGVSVHLTAPDYWLKSYRILKRKIDKALESQRNE